MSRFATESKASASASSNASNVCALAVRRTVLTFDQQSSIGFKSGEYGGKNSSRAPTDSINCRMRGALCDDKLSISTISPRRKVGSSTRAMYTSKAFPSRAPVRSAGACRPCKPNVARSV